MNSYILIKNYQIFLKKNAIFLYCILFSLRDFEIKTKKKKEKNSIKNKIFFFCTFVMFFGHLRKIFFKIALSAHEILSEYFIATKLEDIFVNNLFM